MGLANPSYLVPNEPQHTSWDLQQDGCPSTKKRGVPVMKKDGVMNTGQLQQKGTALQGKKAQRCTVLLERMQSIHLLKVAEAGKHECWRRG